MKFSRVFKIFVIVAFLFQSFSNVAFAMDRYSCLYSKKDFSKRLLKENLILTKTMSDISSEKALPCDKISLKILEELCCGDQNIIPCGSLLEGRVEKKRNNLIFRSDAYIDILLTNIKLPSGCCICFENNPIKLRIVDPNYKTLVRRFMQRVPILVSGPAVSIPLGAAGGLGSGVVFAITIGAQTAAGFLSGFIDPDIDKTRFDGAITRAVEGTPVGTFLIAVERGYEIKSPACQYVTIRLDKKTKQKIISLMNQTVASNK